MYLPSRRDIIQVLPYYSFSSFGNTTLPFITQLQPNPHHSQAISQATIAVLCLGLIVAVALCLVLLRVLAVQRRETTGSLRDLPLAARLSKAMGCGSNRRRDRMDRSDSGSLISEVEERGGVVTTTSTSLPLHKSRSTNEGHSNIFSRRIASKFGNLSISRKKKSHRKNSSSINRNEIRTAVPSNWIYETSSTPVILPMSRMECESKSNHQPSSSTNGSGGNSSGTTFSLHSHSNSTSSYNRSGSFSSPSGSAFSASVQDSYSYNGFRTTPPQSPIRAIYPSTARRGSNFSTEAGTQVVRRESVALKHQAWEKDEMENSGKEQSHEETIFVIEDSFPTPPASDSNQFSFSAQTPQSSHVVDPSASPKSSRPINSNNKSIPRLCASESFQRLVASEQSFGYAVEDPYRRPSQVSTLNEYSMDGSGSNQAVGGTGGEGIWNWTGVSESISEERRGSAATSRTVHASSRRPSWLDGHSHSNPSFTSSLRRPSAGPLPTPDQVHVHFPGHDLRNHMHLQSLSQPLPASAPAVLKRAAGLAARGPINHSASTTPSSPLSTLPVSAPNSVARSETSTSTPDLNPREPSRTEQSPSIESGTEDFDHHPFDSSTVLRRFGGCPPMLRSISDAPSAISLPRTVSRAGSLDFGSEDDETIPSGSDWEEEMMSDGGEEEMERDSQTGSHSEKKTDLDMKLESQISISTTSLKESQAKSSSDLNQSLLGFEKLNSSPTSARLKALARPPALLPASLASHHSKLLQNKINLQLNGKYQNDSDWEEENENDELTPRFSRFSSSTLNSNGSSIPSPTCSLAPTLIESSNSDPNSPMTPSAPITPSNKIQPLPTLDENQKQLGGPIHLSSSSSQRHYRLSKKNSSSRIKVEGMEVGFGNHEDEDLDLQGAFKESFLLDVGNGRAVAMNALPTPSLEKENPLGGWL